MDLSLAKFNTLEILWEIACSLMTGVILTCAIVASNVL